MNKRKLQMLLIFAALTSAPTAFAADYATSNTFNIGSLTFTPSSKVTVRALSSSTNKSYIAESLHSSGSRTFATDQVSSILYWRDQTQLDALTVPGNNTSHGTPNFTTASGWTSL